MTSSRNSTSSRGQVQQVYIFLSAVIVILATIFLGMKLFTGLSGSACDASDADFLAQLRRTLDTNAAYGSRNTVTVAAPCEAEMVCFVDATRVGLAGGSLTVTEPELALIETVVNQGVETNIFLKKEDGLMEAGYDQRITVEDGYICYPAERGKFTLRVLGGGRFITLAEVP